MVAIGSVENEDAIFYPDDFVCIFTIVIINFSEKFWKILENESFTWFKYNRTRVHTNICS